jgi:starch synthase (maltosyl-transferring)
LQFLRIDDEQLLAYVKSTADLTNVVVVVVNLDPHHAHAGYVELPLAELGIDGTKPYQVDDLLGGARYLWHGPRNFVALDPQALPAHVFRLRRRIRTERDFDYYQ